VPDTLKRWARRTGLAILILIVAVTALSLVFNSVTSGRAKPPAGLTYVQAGDIKTRYLSWGTTGSPIVLVHGFAESADTWDALGPRLAKAGHRVYAYDLTGFGYSQRSGHYTAEHLARQLLGFLSAVHAPGATVVGHSSGAAVIAQAALDDPGQFAKIVFLDGDALNTGAGSKSPLGTFFIDPYKTSVLRFVLHQDWLVRSIYSRQCGPSCPPLTSAQVATWTRPFEVHGAEAAVWSMLGSGVVGLPVDQVARLHALTMPKKVIFGAEDSVFSKASPAQTATRIGAPPPTIIPGAHHLSMISNPAQVAAAILH
jgi:pimeloyl-ACP methyl ester carboxylesterase